MIEPDDVLLVQGAADEIAQLCADAGLSPRDEPEGGVVDTLFNRGSGLAEVIVPPRSALIGTRRSSWLAIALRREHKSSDFSRLTFCERVRRSVRPTPAAPLAARRRTSSIG